MQQIVNEMALMKSGWHQNMKDAGDQEKATSEIVDETFESMRTYWCWLDYLCETVLYSSLEDSERIKKLEEETGMPFQITTEHIDRLPSCAKPQDIEIPGTRLKFMNQCSIGRSELLAAKAEENYQSCRRLVNNNFSELPDPEKGSKNAAAVEAFKNQSGAIISIERALKAKSAEKQNRALQNKLSDILNKMYAMEAHMELLKEQMFKIDTLIPCYAAQCD